MLADIAHHEPVALERLERGHALTAFADFFDELDVTPCRRREPAGIVVTVTGKPESLRGKRVPFLASHFTGFAADAERRIGEKPVTLSRFDRTTGGKLRFLRDDSVQNGFAVFQCPRMHPVGSRVRHRVRARSHPSPPGACNAPLRTKG